MRRLRTPLRPHLLIKATAVCHWTAHLTRMSLAMNLGPQRTTALCRSLGQKAPGSLKRLPKLVNAPPSLLKSQAQLTTHRLLPQRRTSTTLLCLADMEQ